MPLDLATLPTDPAEALALLPPELLAQYGPMIALLPEEAQRAALAALPAVYGAIERGDYAAFEAALRPIGLDFAAPMIWQEAQSFV